MRTRAPITDSGQYLTSVGTPSHFSASEFACRCGACSFTDVDQGLIDGLEALRALAGSPIKIVSGIRCPAHNSSPSVGGKPASKHLPDSNGISGAADLKAVGSEAPSSGLMFLLSLSVSSFGGRGLGGSTIHVDSRPARASWTYGTRAGQKPERWIASLIDEDFKGG